MKCNGGRSCPYLSGKDIWGLLSERDYLRERISHMEALMALAEERIRELTEENKKLSEENKDLLYRIKRAVRKIFKPNVKKDGEGSKRGAPKGHPGVGRIKPKRITEYKDVYPKECVCGCTDIEGYENSFDEHIVEDIEVRKKVICYRMHYGRCRRCKSVVAPQKDESIIANGRIGPQARAVSSYLRHIGVPYRKVAKIFKEVFHLEISHASVLHFEKVQAENGALLYEGIKQEVRGSPHVNVDETGWRVDGQGAWLWVFVAKGVVLYHIDESRGGKAVTKVLGSNYGGILVSDFYSAYSQIETKGNQRCLAHLLGDVKEIEEKKGFLPETTDGRFCIELKEVLKEGISDWRRYKEGSKDIEELQRDKEEIISKVIEIIQLPIEDEDTQRIRSRTVKHNEELFTFLDNPQVEPTNNVAERHLRPGVIMRKITFCNRTWEGARRFEILMSAIQTGRMKRIEPLQILLTLTMKQISSFDAASPIRGP
jgi:transposase